MLIHEKISTRDLSIYFLTYLAAVPLVVSSCTAEPVRLGYIEKVWVESLPINLDAKLDTGAETSSLSAIEIRTFQINREDWVSFLVPLVKLRIVGLVRTGSNGR